MAGAAKTRTSSPTPSFTRNTKPGVVWSPASGSVGDHRAVAVEAMTKPVNQWIWDESNRQADKTYDTQITDDVEDQAVLVLDAVLLFSFRRIFPNLREHFRESG